MQENKVKVFELVLMDLLNNALENAMTSLFVLYNTNPVPLTICVQPPPPKIE
jgi:hypothetical protein